MVTELPTAIAHGMVVCFLDGMCAYIYIRCEQGETVHVCFSGLPRSRVTQNACQSAAYYFSTVASLSFMYQGCPLPRQHDMGIKKQ